MVMFGIALLEPPRPALEKQRRRRRFYPEPRREFQIVVDAYRSDAHAGRDFRREPR